MEKIVNDTAHIKERIGNFIRSNFLFGDANAQLRNNDSFLEQGIIDSTGVLELVGFVEETYGIKVKDEEMLPENLDSLIKLEAYIIRKLKAV